MRTFETRPHTSRSEAVLCNIPHPVDHRIKDVVAERLAKAKRSSTNVVSERVAHEGWSVRSEIGSD